ncbi:ATP-dependent RecD-like DNA helicase [candidate division CSSED10-310 bacterium]|uniref:ATP-dependent RecD-like DNA helicase n=1 Tax=candidate division CSSED10-310 bacterium TaxID=2855610 RepID=A0ABV6YTU5_UNCC1
MTLTRFEGVVKKVIYRNDQNSFTVMNIEDPEGMLIRAVGTVGPVREGDSLYLHGDWEDHPRYGRNFKLASYEVALPNTLSGIQAFLESGRLKGIGPKMARQIIARFGTDTMRILDEEPELLLELPNIGSKRLGAIKKGWHEHHHLRGSIIYLQGLGLSSNLINRALQKFGHHAAVMIRENPYCLTDLTGIGFHKADRVAADIGISRESGERARAGLIFTLNELVEGGHCYYPKEDFLDQGQKLLDISRDIVAAALGQLLTAGRIIIRKNTEELIYRADVAHAEAMVAHHLLRLQKTPLPGGRFFSEAAIDQVAQKQGVEYSPGQRMALKTLLTSKVSILTGGPGTGKTTVIQGFISITLRAGLRIRLAAPTGRAAQKLKETTNIQAQTIHRLLEYNPVMGGFARSEENPIEADIIVIDESSMIDIFIMHALVRAVPDSALLVLVGDADQLPSVGPGNVLGDIMSSGRFPLVKLTVIFRQAAQSLIVSNAHLINQGQMISIPKNVPAPQKTDFYFIDRSDPNITAQTILYLITERIPQAFDLDPLKDIQVITPMHQGETGAQNLNILLQKSLNQGMFQQAQARESDFPFYQGDRVMQIRNNYNRGQNGIFNGDIGFITHIDFENKFLRVQFEESIVYEFHEVHELALAYAITVHKSQGSEYPAIILPLLTQHYMLLQRNLLYTAITRAQRLAVIIGSYKALSIAIKNDKTSLRFTGLRDLLQQH